MLWLITFVFSITIFVLVSTLFVFSNKVRRHGGLILHILVATYMFIGLAIVCDDYFVPSLNKVSDGAPPMIRPVIFPANRPSLVLQ